MTSTDLPVIQAMREEDCPACGQPIRIGDHITPETTEDLTESFTGRLIRRNYLDWRHETCPTPRGTTTCPSCFLERPCPCEDGQ